MCCHSFSCLLFKLEEFLFTQLFARLPLTSLMHSVGIQQDLLSQHGFSSFHQGPSELRSMCFVLGLTGSTFLY